MSPLSASKPFAPSSSHTTPPPRRRADHPLPSQRPTNHAARDTFEPSARPFVGTPQGAPKAEDAHAPQDPSLLMAEAIAQVCESARQTIQEAITGVSHLVAMFDGLRTAWQAFALGAKAFSVSAHHAKSSVKSYFTGLFGKA